MGLLGNLLKWGKVKEKEAADALEKGNEVAFAEQDLGNMEKEFKKVAENLGKIKARKLGLDRDIKEKDEEIKTRTSDAQALLDAGKEELASKHCAIVEDLQIEVATLKNAVKQTKELLTVQEKNKDQLKDAIDQARRDIKMMKTMSDVVKSNESLSVVDVGGTTSALSSFQARKKKMQERLDISKIATEEKFSSTTTSLDDETAKALGKTKGSSLLEQLKNKKS